MARDHRITVVISGQEIVGWSTYEISVSMIDPADRFSMDLPFNREAWDLCKPDRPVQILIDGVSVITGWIDDREIPEGNEVLQITGRDKVGRMVQESAPGLDFTGTDMLTLIGRLATPYFPTVSLVNTRNRRVLRGKGRKARAGREPVFVTTAKKGGGRRIEPGQTRWQVIQDLCHQAEILCWGAGDGSELIIGLPNYDQAPQFRLFQPREGSTRGELSSVLGLGVKESVGDRYSEIIVVGSGGGTQANYGTSVAQRAGRVVDDRDFTIPKRLILEKSVASSAEAQAYAEREMNLRNSKGRTLICRAPRHGQILGGNVYTLFAPDLMCAVEDERIGMIDAWLIVGCTYKSNRQGAEETMLELVPRGQELAL